MAMKKKIDPEYYPTDALITSDEWDSFDYNLRLEIKELGMVNYDDLSEDWKKNTYAFGYLFHAEKLLNEKGEMLTIEQWKHAINNIRELKTLIKKYDHLKTFLLTLRLATITYRAGLIPKFTTEGAAYLNRQSHAGQQKPAGIQTRDDQIREHFKKAHNKNLCAPPIHELKKGIKLGDTFD